MSNNLQDLVETIEAAWEDRAHVTPETQCSIRDAINDTMDRLDKGQLRVASPIPDGWCVHSWIKKAILLSFRLDKAQLFDGGPEAWGKDGRWYDKVPLKCAGWTEADFQQAGFRAVPGVILRRSAYVAPDAVLMPCFVNVGARIDEQTMIDSWATVGSCAQIGRGCHISGGVGIGGVLEPPQASPVIIEDECFIGARSEIAEGVRIGRGAVLSMGVFIGASTPVVDRETGAIHRGCVPPYSVVVPGSLPSKLMRDGAPGPSLACAVIVKQVDAKTRRKTAINDLLRA